eukprot:gene5136-10265_t
MLQVFFIILFLIFSGWIISKVWKKSLIVGIVLGVKDLIQLLLTVRLTSFMIDNDQYSFADFIEDKVDKFPTRLQFITVEDSQHVTLDMIETDANKFAHWAKYIGFQQKDTIALMLLNSPSILSFWFGFAKIGVTTALINTCLTNDSLIHSIDMSLKYTKNKFLIIDSELKDKIQNDIKHLTSIGISIYTWDEISSIISEFSTSRPSRSLRSMIKEKDPLLLIHTSGTTGLPKASKITSTRLLLGSLPFKILCHLTPEDRIYLTLPLYHSAACILGMGGALQAGSTIVLRKKFSARNFTSDCLKFNCTVFQYIGEIGRYLCSAPPDPNDSKLNLRYAFGNGLRTDVWMELQRRYGIERVVEFYAATEGNVMLFNNTGKVGAIGFVPRVFDFLYPVRLLKVSPSCPNIPLRNPSNELLLCQMCTPNEIGLLAAQMDEGRLDRRFDGYSDDIEATNRKIIRNVLKQGDAYFNSGDLLTRDRWGFFFWVDRVGDTFRWKGENVSTTEIEDILSSAPCVRAACVYGVSVPGCEGRAGMVAIAMAIAASARMDVAVGSSSSFWEIREDSRGLGGREYTMTKENETETYDDDDDDDSNGGDQFNRIPPYARPVFVRIVRGELLVTSTFKLCKTDLAKQSFDPYQCIGDKLFLYRIRSHSFIPLSKEIHMNILNGIEKL